MICQRSKLELLWFDMSKVKVGVIMVDMSKVKVKIGVIMVDVKGQGQSWSYHG